MRKDEFYLQRDVANCQDKHVKVVILAKKNKIPNLEHRILYYYF